MDEVLPKARPKDLLDSIEFLIWWMRQPPLDTSSELQSTLGQLEALCEAARGLAPDVEVTRPELMRGSREPYRQKVVVGC